MTYLFVPAGIRVVSQLCSCPICLTETVSEVCTFVVWFGIQLGLVDELNSDAQIQTVA